MKYPIRVLHIVRYLEQGGIQNLLMNLYRHIDRNKVQFDFLVCGDGVFDDEVKKLGGRIYQMNYLTDLGTKRYENELIYFFKEHKEYKIIHSHLNEVSGIVMEAAKKAGVPVRIAHSHNTGNNNNFIQKIYKIYLKSKICKNATNLFACSKEAADWLFKRDSNKAIIISNGIDIERFSFEKSSRLEIRKLYGIDEKCVVLGNVGRLIKQKNQLYLLDIFKCYHEENPNSKFMIVGEGKFKSRIENKIKKLKMEESVFLIKPTKEIEKYYSAFDYFLFPSKYEGLGMVLIEAQVSGLRCFASDKVIHKTTKVSQNIEYINLKSSPSEWANYIPKENNYNRENVKLNVQEFDIGKISKKLQKFYEEKNKEINVKKILHIGMSDKLGGIETFVRNLYINIDKDKFKFDFIDNTSSQICYKDEFEKMGSNIYKVVSRKKNIFLHKKQLKEIIKDNNYCAIHFHLNTWSYVEPIILAKKFNVKIIVHSHNEWNGTNFKTLLLDKINRKRCKNINMIRLACSDLAGKWIFENQNYTIINNGINIEDFKYTEQKRMKIRKELNICEDDIVIGHVGAFREQKNHSFLIDIFYEYLKLNSNSVLVLVGDGELKEKIKEKVNELNISNKVRFLGVRNDINNILSAFDYFVFPSKFEGLPISVVEAQAANLNCIISSKITKQIILSDKVQMLDTKLPQEWANLIYNTKIIDRNTEKDNENLKKYDIRTTAKNMEQIYYTGQIGEN